MDRVSASSEVVHPITTALTLDSSRAHFRTALNQILLKSLIGRWWSAVERVIWWLTRRQQAVPFTISVVFLNIMTLTISYSISLLLGETTITRPAYLLSRLVWVAFTVVYILVMNAQLTRAVAVLSTTITENIPSTNDLAALQNLIQKGLRGGWQFPFSLAFALIAGVWIPWVLSTYSGVEFLVGAIVLHVLNYFQVGMYIYFLLVVISVILALSRFELDIYANDPSVSPVILSIYEVCSTLTVSAAALGAVQYFLMSVSRIDMSAPFAFATLIVLGFLPPVGLFVTSQLSLARIMTEAKGRKLAQIQKLILQKESGSDLASVETMENIQRLMDFHDRIKSTPNSMINLNSLSNLLGSLLLPLIATILGNMTAILSILGMPSSP